MFSKVLASIKGYFAKRAEANRIEIEKFGRVLASEPFSHYHIKIYEDGYVKVSKLLGLIKGEVEELWDISGSTEVSTKTGVGRAAGAAATLGANILLSSNMRGSLYLTISTDCDTYAMVWERPDSGSIKSLNRLIASGRAVIARRDGSGSPKQFPFN